MLGRVLSSPNSKTKPSSERVKSESVFSFLSSKRSSEQRSATARSRRNTHSPLTPHEMDPARGRRERAPKRGAAALAELAALRRGGGGGGDADAGAAAAKTRLDAFELKEEGAVYDVVTEEEYADLVSKRRREGGP